MNSGEKRIGGTSRLAALVVLLVFAATVAGFVTAWAQKQKTSKFASADKCKSCHDAPRKGNPFGKWKDQDPHAKAYQTLASEKAKEVGKKNGVPEPQKSEKCLKCHVTAFTEAKEKKIPDFKNELGVQCDSCHGPGAYHVDTRTDILVEMDFAEGDDPFGSEQDEVYKPLPDGEIIVAPKEEVCKKCHNKDSPSFKPDYYTPEKRKKIQHLDPRKKR